MATPFRVVFLEASVPLVKTLAVQPDGTVDSSPYPHVKKVTSHEKTVTSIQELYQHIVAHAAQGHCLYKGLLDKHLDGESRAGHTLTQEPTSWVCIDLDDYPAPDVATAMRELGFDNVQHIVQHSAKAGFSQGLRAHVFFLLANPKTPTLLKAWLKHLNLSLELPTELTASGLALRWPVDVSTCQNDKLLYIAPPSLNVPDPIPCRIELVAPPTAQPAYTIPPFPLDTEARALELVNQLRSGHGLRRRSTLRLTRKGGYDVLRNPEPAIVTDVKEERGFTYLNLNGGDSWGYFYPSSKPEILSNFKDEPCYLLREIVPDYYAQLQAAPPPPPDEELPPADQQGVQRWVGIDKKTSRYFKAAYDPQSHAVELMPSQDRTRLLDYTAAYNLPAPEVLHDWDIRFDPTDPEPVDFQRRTINLYAPSPYWLAARKRLSPGQHPKGAFDHAGPILKLITHVLGGCAESFNRFMNWNAFILQTGLKPQTAWIFHGRTGTGKGLLFQVLRELYGKQALTSNVEALSDRFNSRLARAQLLLVDEADSEQMEKHGLAAKLREWITEDTIPVRAMRVEPVEEPSYFGVIFAANLPNAAIITLDDRRYNIPPRQEQQLLEVIEGSTGEFRSQVLDPLALEAFANMLAAWEVDESLVYQPMESEAKRQMQAASLSSPDHLLQALRTGDFRYFVLMLPPPEDITDITPQLTAYRELVSNIYADLRTVPYGTRVTVPLTRTDLRTMFGYLVGWKNAPSRFDTALSRYGVQFEAASVPYHGSIVLGMPFEFAMDEATDQAYQAITTTRAKPQMRVVGGADEP